MFKNIKVKVRKRFAIALLSISSLSFMSTSLMILFMFKKVTFIEISPLLMAVIPGIVVVAGGFFTGQSITDHKKIQTEGGKKNEA